MTTPHRPVPPVTTAGLAALVALALVLVLGGCGDDDGAGPGTGSGPTSRPEAAPVITPAPLPTLDPADVVDGVDNPYFPLRPGTRWVYEGTADGEVERTEVVVTDERKQVMGISAVVVRDTVRTGDGTVLEDTRDWYAQDREGNVWYLGEAVENFEDGRKTDTDGSWEAGVDGARPGILLPAHPRVGDAYYQELYEGEAEDRGEVIAVGGTARVAAGEYEEVLTTRDWNPLEPKPVEEKRYAPGVGLISERLVRGGDEQSELVELTPAR